MYTHLSSNIAKLANKIKNAEMKTVSKQIKDMTNKVLKSSVNTIEISLKLDKGSKAKSINKLIPNKIGLYAIEGMWIQDREPINLEKGSLILEAYSRRGNIEYYLHQVTEQGLKYLTKGTSWHTTLEEIKKYL